MRLAAARSDLVADLDRESPLLISERKRLFRGVAICHSTLIVVSQTGNETERLAATQGVNMIEAALAECYQIPGRKQVSLLEKVRSLSLMYNKPVQC